MDSTRTFLHLSTAGLHRQVERVFAELDLADPDDYAGFLSLQSRALLPLESALERQAIQQLLSDWPQRRRSDALKADLRQLNVAPVPAVSLDFPIADDAFLWGVAYVLEGARLGGAVLLKRVVSPARRFLQHGQGAALWPSFLQSLEAAVVTSDQRQSALEGARLAFDAFGRVCLERHTSPAP